MKIQYISSIIYYIYEPIITNDVFLYIICITMYKNHSQLSGTNEINNDNIL